MTMTAIGHKRTQEIKFTSISDYKNVQSFVMSKLGSTLTLGQFMLRNQVIKQYRNFIRTARRLPDKKQSSEIIDWVRSDFKQNKSIPNSEEEQIKALLYQGEKMLNELKQNVDLAIA